MPRAYLDDKDLLTDSFLDAAFGYESYDWQGEQAVGFVNDVPTYIDMKGNTAEIFLVYPYRRADQTKLSELWKRQIIENITGLSNVDFISNCVLVLDEDTNILYTFILFSEFSSSIYISFRHYVEEQD